MKNVFVANKPYTLEGLKVGYRVDIFKRKTSFKNFCFIVVILYYLRIIVIVLSQGTIFLGEKVQFENGIHDTIMIVITILFSLSFGALIFSFPYLKVRELSSKSYRAHLNAGLPMISTIKICDEGFVLENEQGSNTTNWNQVSKGYLYKDYLVFAVADTMIEFKLSDLIQGTQDELIVFLKEKIQIVG